MLNVEKKKETVKKMQQLEDFPFSTQNMYSRYIVISHLTVTPASYNDLTSDNASKAVSTTVFAALNAIGSVV